MAPIRNINTTPPVSKRVEPLPNPTPSDTPIGFGNGGRKPPNRTNAVVYGIVFAIAACALILAKTDENSPIAKWLEPESAYTPDGPFAYRYTKGEILSYQLDARASGEGFDAGTGSGIGLTMNMGFTLETKSIDSEGNGTLQLDFNRVNMTGNFMGDPVTLYQSGDEVEMDLNKFDKLDTKKGDSISGIPHLEFFRKPITMTVAPDGHVNQVDGAPGFDMILSPSKAIAPSRFSSSHLEIGETWDSEFVLPVPGLAMPATAIARNTLIDYVTINNRRCAQIKQELLSVQTDGTLNSPGSVLSKEMNFSMPTFEISGINMIFFDVDDGKLVRTEMNLFFRLEIGEQLEEIKTTVGMYSEALNDLESSNYNRKKEEPAAPLVDMGVSIDATLALVE